MSTLFNVLFAWKCSSTHHKLALDALRLLQGDSGPGWRDCFLAQADAYLKGAKAPDDTFKDFTNHVVHVKENYWGGAPQAAANWYAKTVQALKSKQWSEGAYAAGVLSHYFSDPLMPLHTAQSEAEGAVHRPLEWSVTKSYEALRDLLEQSLGGFPQVVVPSGNNWLEEMVRAGADLARPAYEMLIAHYDLARGVKDPCAGLDQASKECLARLLGHAASGIAHLLEQAIHEAGVQPPRVNLTLSTVLATLTVPIAFITRKLQDVKERALVEAIYREFQQTGKVIHALPEDDFAVRKAHAEEVLRLPLAALDARPPESWPALRLVRPPEHTTKELPFALPMDVPAEDPPPHQPATEAIPSTLPFALPLLECRLRRDMPVVEAPSIGPKTAARLHQIGVQTVADLLALDPADAASRIKKRHITAATIADWQAQATLMCEVPGLRVHDTQILVACEIRSRAALASSQLAVLHSAVQEFVATTQGERILRSSKKPDEAEVREWIQAAREDHAARAA